MLPVSELLYQPCYTTIDLLFHNGEGGDIDPVIYSGCYERTRRFDFVVIVPHIRDRGSDLYVGIDMVKNYCLYKWYGRCSAKKGQKLSQITPN